MISVDRQVVVKKKKHVRTCAVSQFHCSRLVAPNGPRGLKFLASADWGRRNPWPGPGRRVEPAWQGPATERERARANLALERFRKSTTSQQQASGYGST